MALELYEQAKVLLKDEDNALWLDKVSCWVEREEGYNIYIFQVILDNQIELENYYETITSSIAVDFQTTLEKAIEKWNIYIVFECKSRIDLELKEKIEQDKYSSRKLVWDTLDNVNDIGYLQARLLGLNIEKNGTETKEKETLLEKIREKNFELYSVLQNEGLNIDQKTVVYIGDDVDEQEN